MEGGRGEPPPPEDAGLQDDPVGALWGLRGEKGLFFGPAGKRGEAGRCFGGRPEPSPDENHVVSSLHPLGVPGAVAGESLTEGLL